MTGFVNRIIYFFYSLFHKENTMSYIRETGDNFTLVDQDGNVVGTYSRARDARRGAARRGLVVA